MLRDATLCGVFLAVNIFSQRTEVESNDVTWSRTRTRKTIETQLKEADDAIRNQLLATWKGLILEEMVELFAITDDPQILRCLDSNIALGGEITRGKKMMAALQRGDMR